MTVRCQWGLGVCLEAAIVRVRFRIEPLDGWRASALCATHAANIIVNAYWSETERIATVKVVKGVRAVPCDVVVSARGTDNMRPEPCGTLTPWITVDPETGEDVAICVAHQAQAGTGTGS